MLASVLTPGTAVTIIGEPAQRSHFRILEFEIKQFGESHHARRRISRWNRQWQKLGR